MKAKWKKKLKYLFYGFAVYYLSNIIIYYLFLREQLIKGVEILYSNEESSAIFESNNISKKQLLDNALIDLSLFNPIINLAYSLGNRILFFSSSTLVILFIIFLKIREKRRINKGA